MKTKNGFTLIEMLVVMSVLSILLLLTVPSQTSLIKKIQEEEFMNQFKEDVLFVQNQAALHPKERIYIRLYTDRYVIIRSRLGPFETRIYPKGWTYSSPINVIEFSVNGTIRYSGSIRMNNEDGGFLMTFPLGKGRFYID